MVKSGCGGLTRGRDMKLSLAIPFYNEEKNVKRVVSELVNEFEKASIDYELILVNNGSIDDTPHLLENLAKENPKRIKLVHVPVNQGYGWGSIGGFKEASGECVGYMCGDGQIKPQDVLMVFDCINTEDYDLVKVKRAVRKDGIIRKVLSRAYNFLFLVFFNVKTLDVNASPKIFKRELLAKISPASKDWFIDAEIMIKAKYLKLKVREVPVEFLHREKGRSHVGFTTILEFARNMFDYKLGRGIREWKQKTIKS
jgi:glycosyltransferase involved in cell wall biosynthesis